MDAWSGIGYLALTSRRITHGILGGQALKGGEATSTGNVSAAAGATSALQAEPRQPARNVGDPIDTFTGAFLYAANDLTLGPGHPPFGLTLERSYSSGDRANGGPFGPGWTHNFQITATEDSDGLLGLGAGGSAVDAAAAIVAATVKLDLLQGGLANGSAPSAERLLLAALIEAWLMDRLTGNVVRIDQPGDGRRFVKLPDGTFNPPPGHADVLEASADGYRLTAKDGLVLDFATLLGDAGTDRHPRRTFALDTWTDRHGNRLRFGYDQATRRLARVDTDAGHAFSFQYDAQGRIARIADHSGRGVDYAYDPDGNLRTVTDPLGRVRSYCWDDARLTHLSDLGPDLGAPLDCTDPRDAFLTNHYDSLGRVARQTNAAGRTWTYRFAGTRSEEIDPDGNIRAWAFNDRGKVTRAVDALGQATTTAYDGQDRPVRITRPEGNVTALTYDARHNLTAITHHPKPGSPESAAGRTLVETFTYEPRYHRIASHTDARGHTTEYIYDADGDSDLDRIEQPAVPLPDGTSARPVTRLAHNPRSQLTETINPAGRVTRYAYDAVGAALTQVAVDPGGLALATTYGYDTLGNRTTETDPRGHTTRLTYDRARQLVRIDAPLGAVTELDYDVHGRPISGASAVTGWPRATAERPLGGRAATVTSQLPRPSADTP
jgi:YD repeat-containing protein